MAAATFPKFFITHSWRDNKFAKRLTDDLKAKGLHGFFDVYSIQPGDNIPSRISQGLEDCDVYIPILSEAAFSSPWCEWELGAAIQLRNTRGRMGRPRIIPVLIDHCAEKVPAILRPIAYVDFSDNYSEGLKKLLIRGMGVGGGKVLRDPSSTSVPPARIVVPPTVPTNVHPVVLIAVVAIVVGSIVLGAYFAGRTPIGGVEGITLVSQSSVPNSPTRAAATRPAATSSSKLSSEPINVVPSATVPTLPTPPFSIDGPMCPEPQYTMITFPMNGSVVSGLTQVKGSVIARPFAQPYRYSLFYRPGIVRDAMDGSADAQAPLSLSGSNGKNQPIQVMYFQPFDAPIVDGVLGTWDTTKLASDWYSLRLWSKDRGGNFVGCDVYVYVKGQ